MRGQVALPGPYLVDASCGELDETHEGLWRELRREVVVCVGGEVFCPSFEESLSGPITGGNICPGHKGGRRYVFTRGGRGLEDEL